MLIIVEGLDNTGKTSLIKWLRKNVLTDPRTTSIHCTIPPNGCQQSWSKDHYMNVLGLCSSMVKSGWTVILDRSHLGEDVFGPLFRDQNAEYIYDLERMFLSNIPSVLILLIDDPEKLVERDDGQSHTVDQQKLQMISDRFVEVVNRSSIPRKMVYNISQDGGFENLNATVNKFLNF